MTDFHFIPYVEGSLVNAYSGFKEYKSSTNTKVRIVHA